MDGFTLLDGGAIFILLLSGILAYSRGFIRELLSIAGWFIAAIVAFIFAPKFEPLIREIPGISSFLNGECELSMIASFAVVFAITLIIVAVFTPLFSNAIQRSSLGGLDQGFGFVFGLVRGIVLILVLLILYDLIVPKESGFDIVEKSRTKAILSSVQIRTIEALPTTESQTWLIEKYNSLTKTCKSSPAQT